jgi:hypothetical protein
MRRSTTCLVAIAATLGLLESVVTADEELRLRMENFTVMPSTGPVVNVLIENCSEGAVAAVVRVRWPAGWKGAPDEQPVTVAPMTVTRVAFTIEKAVDVAANRYPVVVEARVGDVTVTRAQQVVCATTPYLKPQLDGQLDDWKDAVPITFVTAGKKTTVMTCWSRRNLCLAVRAEQAKAGAVQFALAPESTEKPGRHEFVVVAPGNDAPAQCYQLLRLSDDPKVAGRSRPLKGLACEEVQASVTRDGAAMCYEIVVPVKLVQELRPTPGRPFRFSLLLHEPGGLRDLGTVMNLHDDQRSPGAWCRWEGAVFGPTPPFASKVEFGFSSSIH